MTAPVDFAPLADAAADYRMAVGRLEDAAADAEAAWKLLPAALDSPGTQIAVGRYVGPAHQLSTALLQAADALHGALLAAVQPLQALSYQADANPDDASWAYGITSTEAACAATIAAIRGGEAGSVDLPCPAPQASEPRLHMSAASMTVPIAPTTGFPAFGAGAFDAGSTLAAAGALGLLGVFGLILSMGGSSDEVASAPKRDNRKPRPNIDEVRVTPWTPCNPWQHGPGCEEHLSGDKPGDLPFTGDKVKGNEPAGEMPGTKSDWTVRDADNGKGLVYRAPDGRELRVMRPGADARYPNGYVQFTNSNGQPIDLYWRNNLPKRSDAVHITRNRNGSFPMPEGWDE